MPLLEWPRVWGVRMLLLRSSFALRRAERLAAASYRAEDEAAALLAEARTIAHGRLALAVAASRR